MGVLPPLPSPSSAGEQFIGLLTLAVGIAGAAVGWAVARLTDGREISSSEEPQPASEVLPAA